MEPVAKAMLSRSKFDGDSVESPGAKSSSPPRLRPAERALSEEMLARFASRAATYDRENLPITCCRASSRQIHIPS